MSLKDMIANDNKLRKIKTFLVGPSDGSHDSGFLQIAATCLLMYLLPYGIRVFDEEMARGYSVVENSPKQIAVQFYSDPLIKGYDHRKSGHLDSLVSISFSYRIPMYHEFDIPRYADEFKIFDSIYHDGFVNDASLKK